MIRTDLSSAEIARALHMRPGATVNELVRNLFPGEVPYRASDRVLTRLESMIRNACVTRTGRSGSMQYSLTEWGSDVFKDVLPRA